MLVKREGDAPAPNSVLRAPDQAEAGHLSEAMLMLVGAMIAVIGVAAVVAIHEWLVPEPVPTVLESERSGPSEANGPARF